MIRTWHRCLAAAGIATMFVFASAAEAQQDEVDALRAQVEALKKEIAELRAFNERLCRTLRDESIIVFASEPKTPQAKAERAIEEFRGAVDKLQQAMASRNHAAHKRADELRQRAEASLQKLDANLVVPMLKSEVEAASNNYPMCHSMMMALGRVGGPSTIPYLNEIAADKKRPGHMRRIASEVMLSVDKDKAINMLLPVAGDFEAKNFNDRFYVIYMLSETKDPRVLPLLVQGAKQDPDKSARCHHINGLWHYKTPEARETLEWVIENDDYEHARTNALNSLHRMLGDEAAYPLMKHLSKNAKKKDGTPDFRVRNAAYTNMNRIKMNLEKAGKPIPGEAPKDKAAPKDKGQPK